MRQPGIGGANRSNQRIDDFALHPVIEVARIRHILESAPAIGNLLVFCKRVGDQRKGPFVGLEGFRNRLRRRPAFFARAILQQSQGRLDRQLLAADLETQAGDGLFEQPVPGGITALGFLVEQLLYPILELIRLVLAQVLDPRPIMRQFGRLHGAVDHRVVDPVELESEEQQVHRRIGQPLGDVAVELRDRRIDAVAGMNQTGIGAKTPGDIVDRLVAPDGFREPLAAILLRTPFRELALVVGLKRGAFAVQPCQVACDFRRVDTRIEIGQVPFRQFAGLGLGGRFDAGSFALGG